MKPAGLEGRPALENGKTMKKPMLMVALIFLAGQAWADWAVKGEGGFACPEYVAARQINSTKFYGSISWVQGFISGVNRQRALEQGSDSFIGRDFPATSIVQWLEDHCRANPADDLADAAEALVEELAEEQ